LTISPGFGMNSLYNKKIFSGQIMKKLLLESVTLNWLSYDGLSGPVISRTYTESEKARI